MVEGGGCGWTCGFGGDSEGRQVGMGVTGGVARQLWKWGPYKAVLPGADQEKHGK